MKNPFKALATKVRAIHHLFAKLTIIYCIAYASAASAFCLWKQGQGMQMADILAVVLGFFGGELLLLCLKTVLKKDKKEDDEDEDSSEQQSI